MSATVLLVIHVFIAAALIGLILIQHGKGADAGAAFGSGASNTMFGSQGSASFLTRLTAGLATSFFLTSLGLAYITQSGGRADAVSDAPVAVEEEAEKPAPLATDEIPSAPAADKATTGQGIPDIPE